MTKEELLEDRFRIIKEIFLGRARFTLGDMSDRHMTLHYDKYSVPVPSMATPGWEPRAFNALILQVTQDLDRQLEAFKLEAANLQPRSLRKVNIRGRRADEGSRVTRGD